MRFFVRSKRTRICLVLGMFTIPIHLAQAQAELSEGDVYDQAELLHQEVERIRQQLGVLPPRSRTFRLENAQPRHVYFQTQVAFRRSNLLAHQQTGVSTVAAPVAPEGDPSLAQVHSIIQATRAQLDVVKEVLEIDPAISETKRGRGKNVSGALMEVIRSNEILGEVTEFSADWSDIWDRLNLIMAYIGGLLPEGSRYPELAEYVPRKMPGDVALRLFATRAAFAPVAESVGVAELKVTVIRSPEGGTSSTSVHDVSMTLINDIAEVTLRLGAEDVDPPGYVRPSRVLPSHVFQLAGALLEQAKAVGDAHKANR
ncbi:MAG: hypothetical protein GKR90_00415 [Pseudomonadales bacterium]|nr:hypothetical protein [Pseudomonadales bacterium]